MAKILEALARSKSLEILFALEKKGLNFNEIARLTENPTTAMRRTQELQSVGLISRKVLQDKQRNVKYSLTKKGKEALPLVKGLLKLE